MKSALLIPPLFVWELFRWLKDGNFRPVIVVLAWRSAVRKANR